MKRKIIWIVLVVFSMVLFTSCKTKENEDLKKISDLDYTVMDEVDLPEIVLEKIEQDKMESFKFSYSNGEYLYIAVGYGEKPTGGYSIQVEDLYVTDKYVVVKTKLLGPSEDDTVITKTTYPYIVIKTIDAQLPVCYK